MLDEKPNIKFNPIYLACKKGKTILGGLVSQEVREALKTYEIALRRLSFMFNEKNMSDNPLAKLTKSAYEDVSGIEFAVEGLEQEARSWKDYAEKLKEQNDYLREENYKLKIENRSLKL